MLWLDMQNKENKIKIGLKHWYIDIQSGVSMQSRKLKTILDAIVDMQNE